MNRKVNFVSVIIPCYNDGKLLHSAVESILEQTYQNFEIIIVDDGSDDKTTLKELVKISHPKTTVLRKENGGPASARNYGIERSRGEYILTLDADDTFDPTFMEKGLDILNQSPQVGMVTSYLTRIYNKHQQRAIKEGGGASSFIIGNQANASLLYRFQCWEDANGYDEEIPGFEDWEFAINVTKQGWIVYSIPEYLFYYQNTENSQYDRDICLRPEIMKYLTEKHESLFKDHIRDIIYAQEIRIQQHERTISVYKDSYSFKLGNAFLKPMRALKNLFFIIF